MTPATPGRPGAPVTRTRESAIVQLVVTFVVGVGAGAAAAVGGQLPMAPLIGWDVAALLYLGWTWLHIARMDAAATASHAIREDPTRAISNLLLLGASIASLVAVGFVIVHAASQHGAEEAIETAVGTASVVVSWLVVHTTYMLRYAKLFHTAAGGVDFNQKDHAPRYADFAYLAFTIGMTFQVSDTPLTSSAIRAAALRHALLSYLYGTVIIATAINVVAGLRT